MHTSIDLRCVVQVSGIRQRLRCKAGRADLFYDPADRCGRLEHDLGFLRREIDARLDPVESIQLPLDTSGASTAGHPADAERRLCPRLSGVDDLSNSHDVGQYYGPPEGLRLRVITAM